MTLPTSASEERVKLMSVLGMVSTFQRRKFVR